MFKYLLLFVQVGVILAQTAPQAGPYQAEGLPGNLVARTQVRDRFLSALPRSTNGFSPQSVVEKLKRWTPGSTLHVAFNDGSNILRKQVADAAVVWLNAATSAGTKANMKLDFGFNPGTGGYRSWSPSDAQPAAEIRISFNQAGYWSVVGTDALDPSIVKPGEATMNFGGFLVWSPPDAAAIIAHEFGHAFGFQHEHQSPLGGCDSQFRWFDDPGYQRNQDPTTHEYIPDGQGRRPGIYTVLGGPPNEWDEQKVNYNLKQLPNSSAFLVSTFDSKSIMMYSFPSWMFVVADSKCCTTENLGLSPQDVVGFVQAYPSASADIISLINERKDFLEAILSDPLLPAANKLPFQAMFVAIH
jgi:hypothetical protein